MACVRASVRLPPDLHSVQLRRGLSYQLCNKDMTLILRDFTRGIRDSKGSCFVVVETVVPVC